MTDASRTLIFDVNETLLDMAPVKEQVAAALDGRDDLLALWFTTMLQYSLVHSLIDDYRDFADIGVGALMMIAEKEGIPIERDVAEAAIVEPIRHLPAHADVAPALRKLRADGFRLIALTNSSAEGVEAQLGNAGIIDLFDDVLSTEAVRAFKPDPRPYRHALDVAGAKPGEALMVAAHAWDLAGAHAVGLHTAFVSRPGATLYPNVERPDHVIADLSELAVVLAD